MQFLKHLLWCALALPVPGRVLLISLDGMGHDFLQTDPLSAEVSALHLFAKKGVQADGVLSAFPSTTANAHAALWTGAWGDVNGISGNTMPRLPRSNHTVAERMIGYRSDGLRAEPIWVAAARQGVKVVAQQVTQAYPFSERSVGEGLKVPPIVLNGYQTRLISDHAALRRADMKQEACGSEPGISTRKPLCFTWNAGPVVLHGTLSAPAGAYTVFSVRTRGGSTPVQARLAPLEATPPRKRALARHFSEGLFLDAVGDAGPAVLYFRLFEAAADGSDFLLYQTPIHELGMHPAETRSALMREAGGFIGNGPTRLLTANRLGTEHGIAERRYLEAVELVTSLSVRHARWLIRHEKPQLFIGYLNYPDETEHQWKGRAALDPRYNEFRRWAYVVVNRAVSDLIALRSPGDDMLFVSDHGMAPVYRQVHINRALADAGMLAVDAKGRVIPGRTQVLDVRNCLLINTTDWKSGIVRPDDIDAVKRKALDVLRGIRDPATGTAVVTETYARKEEAERFGFDGSAGADICYNLAPGYIGMDTPSGPLVQEMKHPLGAHGFAPTRTDMQAVFIAAGPGFPRHQRVGMASLIDIAPTVARLLSISPPAQSRGKSLFSDTKR